MNKINFTITLKSDGEPGSGFGTELIDSLVPRNYENRIMLPASHLKGIIRENLENLAENLSEIKGLQAAVNELFGEPANGENGKDTKNDKSATNNDSYKKFMRTALFHIGNAVADKDIKTIDISRTSLNEFGVAEDSSLRTTEAVATGTVFKGSITTHPRLTEPYKNILKLGLLSLFAVGGSRSRGAGACFVEIADEKRMPGEILKELANTDFDSDEIKALSEAEKNASKPEKISDEYSILKLTFRPDGPICVPDIPVVANNMISTGFAIPASAVQGAILYRINDICEELASACFENEHFRAWPMYPTDNKDNFSLCCPLSQKIGKTKIKFEDEIIEQTKQDKKEENTPMRGVQGILLTDGKIVKLWKANEIPRIITAHGVHNGDRGTGEDIKKRNLFTVESIALPSDMFFTGIISLPKNIAELLMKSLKENPFIQLGKARSVRGGGKLSAEPIKLDDLPLMKNCEKNVFIVQSPLRIPQNLYDKPFEDIISSLVNGSKFGEIEEKNGRKQAKGSISTQFGWNSMKKGLISAKAVIFPGTVFKLKEPVDNLEKKLIKGIGQGREQGFGAVLPHPGLAKEPFKLPAETKTVKAFDKDKNFGKEGFELYDKAKKSGLSASQISRLREYLSLGAKQAKQYLDRQQKERPAAVWQRWAPIFDEIRKEIENVSNAQNYIEHMEHIKKKLKICQDLLVADREDE